MRPVILAWILSVLAAPAIGAGTVTVWPAPPGEALSEDYSVTSLHILANPPEEEPPCPDDPDVIYFGPGIHEVTHMTVGSGKTVYVAGGAIVRGVIAPEEPFRISSYSGLKTYSPTFHLRGSDITVRGRGIIDGSRSTTHARNLMLVQGSDIRIEESPRLISLWIDESFWTRDEERGHIDGVVFRNIEAAAPAPIGLHGFDDDHAVENVEFHNVTLGGRPLTAADVRANAFVRGLTVSP